MLCGILIHLLFQQFSHECRVVSQFLQFVCVVCHETESFRGSRGQQRGERGRETVAHTQEPLMVNNECFTGTESSHASQTVTHRGTYYINIIWLYSENYNINQHKKKCTVYMYHAIKVIENHSIWDAILNV